MKNTSEQDEKVCLVTWSRLLVLPEHTGTASLWPLYRSHCSIPSFHSLGWSGGSVWGRWKLPPWGHWLLSKPTKALRLQSGRTSTWNSNTVLSFRNLFKFPVQSYLQDSSSRSIDDQKLGYPFFALILTAPVNILFDLYPPQLSITVPYNQSTVSTAKRLASLFWYLIASTIDTLHNTINDYEIACIWNWKYNVHVCMIQTNADFLSQKLTVFVSCWLKIAKI